MHIHILGACGTFMGGLAVLARHAGHTVSGSDQHTYPPMSTQLRAQGIELAEGYSPDHLQPHPDLVIVGNALSRGNEAVEYVLNEGIAYTSGPRWLGENYLRGKKVIAVAGTHGKTSTSAMVAWILEQTGADPSYLIGGLPRWNPRGFRLGGGSLLVIEGDEYNTAFFDRGPKFLHYRPRHFLIGPVEFDHADLYPNLEAVLTAFRAGAAQVPRDGSVVVNTWSDGAVAAARDATAPLIRVGPHSDCDLRFLSWQAETDRSSAEISWHGEVFVLGLPQAGLHNLQNAAMAVAAAVSTGIAPAQASAAMSSFPGVTRRMEVIGEAGGITIVDDFAHHPTAIGVTIAAARQRWPGRRLVIAFEPRSLTAARRSFQDSYLEELSAADLVMVAPPYHRDRFEASDVLDREALSTALGARGVASMMPGEDDDLVEKLLEILKSGDVVVGCSSGAFDGLHKKMIEALQTGDEA